MSFADNITSDAIRPLPHDTLAVLVVELLRIVGRLVDGNSTLLAVLADLPNGSTPGELTAADVLRAWSDTYRSDVADTLDRLSLALETPSGPAH